MIAIRCWNPWLARKHSVILLFQTPRALAELNLRGSGSSSAWCSAHKVSAAAGRMFEDPEPLRFSSANALGVWNNNQVGQFLLI
jgi:hypothetical protein